MLEYRVNDDFRGPPKKKLRTIFSLSTVFKSNYENTISTRKACDGGMAVLVASDDIKLYSKLVINLDSSAALDIYNRAQLLDSSGLPIGYQVGSFAHSYMTDSLNIHPSRTVSLGTPEEYESALKRGSVNGYDGYFFFN